MIIEKTALEGVLLVKPKAYKDARGFFMETWHAERYEKSGIPSRFVQDNVSYSERGVLRGMHFQKPFPQGKLVTVLMGEIFDVAIDIRMGSPTFGKWVGETLSSENNHQLWVPEGFAHGFCVTSPTALVSYKCTELYHPECEGCVLWGDPGVGIEWPPLKFQLSKKDAQGRLLSQFSPTQLPQLI